VDDPRLMARRQLSLFGDTRILILPNVPDTSFASTGHSLCLQTPADWLRRRVPFNAGRKRGGETSAPVFALKPSPMRKAGVSNVPGLPLVRLAALIGLSLLPPNEVPPATAEVALPPRGGFPLLVAAAICLQYQTEVKGTKTS